MQIKPCFRICYVVSCFLILVACNQKTQESRKTETVDFVRSEISERNKKVIEDIDQPEIVSGIIVPKIDTIFHQNIRLIENVGQIITYPLIPGSGQLAEVHKRNIINNTETDINPESFTSQNTYLIIDFENDIFTNTDYYFTNGVSITLIHPKFSMFNIHRILPGLGAKSMNYYAIGLRQNMYTGLNPEASEINYHDRPFAGFLALTFSRSSFLQNKQVRLTSSVSTGVLGSYSLAGAFQSGLHDLPPTGWTYQIDNDIIINVSGEIEKALISKKNIELGLGILAQAGSLFTDLSGKIMLKIGQFNPSFNGLPISRKGTTKQNSDYKFQYWISISAAEKWVVHNGTLQGGLLNHGSPFTLNYNDLNHIVSRYDVNLNFYYRQNGIVLNFVQISKEFKEGRQHRWGGISLIHNF